MVKHTKHNPDYLKNKTADVIKHGDGVAVPNKQWEINMNLTPDGHSNPKEAFNPMKGSVRPCTYVKTNECDH